MRDYRRKKKLEKIENDARNTDGDSLNESIGTAVKNWSAKHLLIPSGHSLAGEAMVTPDYAVDFLNDVFDSKARESGLFVARKNGKSAIIACYLLARLVGSIRIKGYRGGVCSVSREKAAELYQQCVDICKASGIDSIEYRVSPFRLISPSGVVDFLSADRSAGHASGFDDAIFDELGLIPERRRDLINGLRSSVSARNGRFIAISILGDSPFTREMVERKDLDTTCIHIHAAPNDCSIDDEGAWRAANPTLDTIKSIEYMRDESARCSYSPLDESAFRAFDLNQPLSPNREMICKIQDYKDNCIDTPIERGERAVIGIDLGGSSSMCAAIVIFVDTGRVETFAAFGGIPNLIERGNIDNVGGLYELMQQRGELRVYDGYRVTPIDAFISDVFDSLGDIEILAIGCDRYRKAELIQALETTGRKPNVIWRGVGAGAFADGSADVRAFQRCILARKFSMRETLTWVNAIAESSLRYDASGNPALDKRRSAARIDVLQAGVIAAGLYEMSQTIRNELEFELVG